MNDYCNYVCLNLDCQSEFEIPADKQHVLDGTRCIVCDGPLLRVDTSKPRADNQDVHIHVNYYGAEGLECKIAEALSEHINKVNRSIERTFEPRRRSRG